MKLIAAILSLIGALTVYAPTIVVRGPVLAQATALAPSPDILWWKNNDASGTTITADAGPNGTTDATWTTSVGGSGSALSFNGSSQDAASSSSITYSTNVLTVSLWLNLDSTAGTQVLVESSVNFNLNNATFILYVESGLMVSAIQMSPLTWREENISAPSSGTWVHVAVIYDNSTSSGDMRMFLNGVEQSTTTGLTTKASSGDFASYTLYLGARASSSLFTGADIDDIRIYSGMLSDSDISLIYSEGPK